MNILGSRQGFALATLLLAASAFISRLMGLARDKIISWQFGAGSEADMYFAAFVIPDIINYLLAGGFMSITIIPILAKGFTEHEGETWRFFSCVLFWIFISSCVLTFFAALFSESLAWLIAPGFNPLQIARLSFFMRLILPAQIFFLTGACFTALLLLRRQFAIPSLTPLIYNGFIILLGLALPFAFNADIGMAGYCVGVTIGSFTGAFLLPFLVASKSGLPLKFVLIHPWMKRFLWIALPLMLGQTIIMLDEQFLRIFGSLIGEGAVSILNYSRRISQVPVALLGQAIATASYPFLVALLAKNEIEKFNQTLNNAINSALLLIIPCAIWMIALVQPILTIIFQGGRFGLEEIMSCVPVTAIMLICAPFWIVYMALVRGYYALGDTITPALTGTIATLICIPIYRFIAVPAGTEAIAILSAISISAYVIWLILIWIKRQGNTAFNNSLSIIQKILFCSIPGGILTFWISGQISLYFHYSFAGACVAFISGSILYALCVISGTYLILPEFVTAFRKRFWRRKG